MNKNDIITLKIEDMGIDGEGIGKIDGPRKTNVNRRTCLNEDSMFLKLLNSIILCFFNFYFFNNTAPTFPVEAPAAAPATLSHFDYMIKFLCLCTKRFM